MLVLGHLVYISSLCLLQGQGYVFLSLPRRRQGDLHGDHRRVREQRGPEGERVGRDLTDARLAAKTRVLMFNRVV